MISDVLVLMLAFAAQSLHWKTKSLPMDRWVQRASFRPYVLKPSATVRFSAPPEIAWAPSLQNGDKVLKPRQGLHLTYSVGGDRVDLFECRLYPGDPDNISYELYAAGYFTVLVHVGDCIFQLKKGTVSIQLMTGKASSADLTQLTKSLVIAKRGS